ncbi:hypothetical protein DRP43_05285 [candidate division TA06 bacterium]|uniref:Uncharacterized protein n=1 Tax=candidate division TA06 bacterium TaxID=2250710 RepID=A0A660SF60_UNCT6|nr:MAG: hypothetical protein DRP43_05285 [candidate division TA06 bacterium]
MNKIEYIIVISLLQQQMEFIPILIFVIKIIKNIFSIINFYFCIPAHCQAGLLIPAGSRKTLLHGVNIGG